MSELRLDLELSAMGLPDHAISFLYPNSRRETNARGLMAMRRGAIDAARVLVDRATGLSAPQEIRETPEYLMGFDANATIIGEREAAV